MVVYGRYSRPPSSELSSGVRPGSALEAAVLKKVVITLVEKSVKYPPRMFVQVLVYSFKSVPKGTGA